MQDLIDAFRDRQKASASQAPPTLEERRAAFASAGRLQPIASADTGSRGLRDVGGDVQKPMLAQPQLPRANPHELPPILVTSHSLGSCENQGGPPGATRESHWRDATRAVRLLPDTTRRHS